MEAILGIDVGKSDLHAAVLLGERTWSKSFANNSKGLGQLRAWLKNHKVDQVHACMESTGGFEQATALDLYEHGHTVSIVNPSRIKAFAQSELLRTKTDTVDAALIARFCKAHGPDAWMPPTPEIRALQALVRRYEALQEMLSVENNRLGTADFTPSVQRSLREHIAFLESELQVVKREIDDLFKQNPPLCKRRELLMSIPGVAELTASRILGEMPDIDQYRNAKAVSAFAGLSPRQHQSGSLRGRTRIAKMGNSRLRKSLYFPSLTAIRFNPLLANLYKRLIGAGKPKLVAITVVMRKLLVLAYGVLKSGKKFDPTYRTA